MSPERALIEPQVTFHVELERCTSTLARVLGLFAQRDLTLTALTLVEEKGGHSLSICFPISDLGVVDTLEAKISNIVGVRSVQPMPR